MGQALKFNAVSYAYGNSAWGDLLTNFNGTAISYDAIGNPTNWRNSSSISWDARRLTNQRMNNSDWLTYTYNSSGIRTQKYYFNDVEMYGTTHDYVLDGTNIIRETVTGDGNNYTLYYLYDTSGSVQGFIYNNSYYYFQKNLQGDVIRILNSSGTVVVEYTYDAWGKVLSVTGSQASTIGQYNPFRYRGYYYDIETGFYYLQSRYYDPTVGRFLNADHPELVGANGGVQGYNLFAYCNNNSIIGRDDSGHDVIWLHEKDSAKGYGHSGALIQNEKGEWYFFYWGPDDENANIISMIIGRPNGYVFVNLGYASSNYNLKYYYDVCRFISDRIGAYDVEDRSSKITSTYYIAGDYTAAFDGFLKLGEKTDLKYNLIFRNCLQVTVDILSLSNPYFESMGKMLIPGNALEMVEQIAYDTGPRCLTANSTYGMTKTNTKVRMTE